MKINLKRILGKKKSVCFFKDFVGINPSLQSLWVFDIKGRRIIKYPDDAGDFEYSSTLNTLSKTEDFISIPGGIASPIKFNGSVLGTIIGFNNKPGPKIDALVLFAGKMVFQFIKDAIETEKVLEETLSLYKEINLLYDIGGDVISCIDLKQVTKLILNMAANIIHADKGSLMLTDEGSNICNRSRVFLV